MKKGDEDNPFYQYTALELKERVKFIRHWVGIRWMQKRRESSLRSLATISTYQSELGVCLLYEKESVRNRATFIPLPHL